MSKKFAAQYTANDGLGRMIGAMKEARKSSGYTQDKFSKVIGISRETVIHIEGFSERTVLSLECEVLKRWYSVCASKIEVQELAALRKLIFEYIFSVTDISADSSIETVFSRNDENPLEHKLTTQSSNKKQQKVA